MLLLSAQRIFIKSLYISKRTYLYRRIAIKILKSVNLFKDQGFDYVRAYDVDGDPRDTYIPAGDPYGRTCIERDGQVYRVDDARNSMDHPNVTLSWVPMPRSYQPEGVTA